jgi:hypothetical protein
MLLDRYQEKVWLFNANMKGTAEGLEVYRGDLVLKEGEVADDMGRRKPPLVAVKEAVLVAKEDKLRFVSGFVDELEQLELLPDLYAQDLADDVLMLFFVANLGKPLKSVVAGKSAVLIPMQRGIVWNELIEELRLEKSDFKGQSGEEKIATLYNAFKDYKPKYPEVSWEEALGSTVNEKRDVWGAV